MTNDIALLGFLQTEKLHGYEIYQRFTNLPELWEIWRIKQSRMYAMLARLEANGYVVATSLPQENRPVRKVFAITSQGKTAYTEWLAQPVASGREFRLKFLLKLFFALQEGPTFVHTLIQNQITSCAEWLNEEQSAVQALLEEQAFKQVVHRFRIGQIQAMLDWLREIQSVDLFQLA